jgi:hypothetical protein
LTAPSGKQTALRHFNAWHGCAQMQQESPSNTESTCAYSDPTRRRTGPIDSQLGGNALIGTLGFHKSDEIPQSRFFEFHGEAHGTP